MIPLTVLRRLDCVLENSKDHVIDYRRRLKADGKFDAEIIERMINHRFKLNFHNTREFSVQNLLGDADKLSANLNNYIAVFSARARKIIEKFKFDEEIEKRDEANRLFEVVKEVVTVDFHPDRITNIEMGYEIPFNRHFYEYEPPHPLDAIEADIEQLEGEIMAMLKEVTA